MSDIAVSSSITLGTEITVLRQRFFVDYTSESSKYFTEEYTLMCKTINQNGIDNIFIKSQKLLPNLKIFDSDGTQLALVTNTLTKALIQNLMKHSSGFIRKQLENLLFDISTQKIFVLWIKLPHSKRFHKNETRVITLEYEASKKDTSESDRILEFHSAPYEVFYVITPPEDFEFGKKELEYYDSEKKTFAKKRKDWKHQKGDPFILNENQDSVTVRITPNTKESILFTYSFKPRKNITAFPYIALGLLIAGASIIAFSSLPFYPTLCKEIDLCWIGDSFLGRQIEYEIGIIGASLVVPRLIQNTEIRHLMKYDFLVPIVIAILGIFFMNMG